VWGAEGPNQFDCSGLVMFSYGKAGYTTPRVSEDQFAAARLIPASRAVPGDLVFYHDSEGDVYHVGIYTGPGKSIAAIDPAEGVNWQPVDESAWDVSFGSFTHT
jgi:cell wall-associated NlpC family hydrolase